MCQERGLRADLLDLLLAARDAETGRGMNEAELVAKLLTFISAGHETTAVALTWTLWLLAKDEAIQRRVYDEVVAVIGHGPVEIARIDALPLTRQAILEAMRLFPPVPMLSRIPKTAMQLGSLAITPRTWVAFRFSRCIGIHYSGTILTLSTRTVSLPIKQRNAHATRISRSAPGHECASGQTSP